MIKKINKLYLYYHGLYKGELLKKIEYKLKDLINYFKFRNKIDLCVKNVNLKDISLNINPNDLTVKDSNDKKIKIFNVYNTYTDIKQKLVCKEVFWRNVKLTEYNDVKIIWEYNRLQYLLPISIKYLKTSNIKFKNFILDVFEEWEKYNKYEYSLNWNSNLEVAIRSLNVALTLMILSDKKLIKKCSKMLYFHGKHLYNEINYSDKCIPNNHVIGEATALLFLSQILDTNESLKWYNKSLKILEKYLIIFDEDGISNENSFSYQWFVTKMYILTLVFVKDKTLFNKINNIINKSLNSLYYIYVDNKKCLNYGDNDDGYLFSFYDRYNLIDDINEYYNYFSRNKISFETFIFDCIFKKFNSYKFNILNATGKDYIYNSKIFIYKKDNNLLFFNAKNIEGHAHNDSLAISLIVNGKDILLDSGTYSYNLDKIERSYYRGRESHSTIQFEEKNAIEIGTFRWINKVVSYINNVEETDEYIKVSGLIQNICSREIIIFKNKNLIEIIDQNNKNDEIETNWIAPNTSSLSKNKLLVDGVNISFENNVITKCKNVFVSKEYLCKSKAKKINVDSKKKLKTIIEW